MQRRAKERKVFTAQFVFQKRHRRRCECGLLGQQVIQGRRGGAKSATMPVKARQQQAHRVAVPEDKVQRGAVLPLRIGHSLLGDGGNNALGELGQQFPLGLGGVRRVIAEPRQRPCSGLLSVCRRRDPCGDQVKPFVAVIVQGVQVNAH